MGLDGRKEARPFGGQSGGRMKKSVGSVDGMYTAKHFYMKTFIWTEHFSIYSIGASFLNHF